MVCCFALSILYYTDKELSKPPGNIVATYMLVFTLLYLVMVLITIRCSSHSEISGYSISCYILSCIFVFLLLCFASYNSAINIELMLKIQNPRGENFVLSQVYYHLFSIGASFLGIGILTIFDYQPWYKHKCHVRRISNHA